MGYIWTWTHFLCPAKDWGIQNWKEPPLIIGGGDRGVVASCSYEARTFGVRSAMPIKMALRLYPQTKVMKGNKRLL